MNSVELKDVSSGQLLKRGSAAGDTSSHNSSNDAPYREARKSDVHRGIFSVSSCDYDSWGSVHKINKNQPASASVEAKRWLLAVVIGLATGLTSFIISFSTQGLLGAKLAILSDLVEQEKLHGLPSGLALLFLLLANVIAAYVAWFLVFIEPTARGSGITDVKCYLNGLRIQSAISLRTYGFRVIGVVFSVASGLPIGTEGSMVHAGAALAAAISRGRCDCGCQDLVNYYWVCCFGRGQSGAVGVGTTPRCCPHWRIQEFCNDAELRGFVVCGAAAGLAAALGSPVGGLLFVLPDSHNFWSTRLSARCLLCAVNSVLIVTFLNSSGAMISENRLMFFDRGGGGTDTVLAFSLWEVLLAAALGAVGGAVGSLYVWCSGLVAALRDQIPATATDPRSLIEVLLLAALVSLLTFALPVAVGSCIDRPVETGALMSFYCKDTQYNDLASLFLVDSRVALGQLAYGADENFSSGSLLAFFFVYATVACAVSGSPIAGGQFVPSLLSGGAFGRFVGNLLVSSGVSVHTGLCCVVGATAVLVGIVRVSPVAAAVIVLEATGDIAYALPLIVAALLAHVVSGVISEGMYEVEIASLQYPYLKEEWAGVSSTARVSRSARDIMSCDPVVLSTRISISRLRVFLQNNSYSLFPVVDAKFRYLGSISRAALYELIQRPLMTRSEAEIEDEESQAMLGKQRTELFADDIIDLTALVDPSALSIHNSTRVECAFDLFRRMELKQIVVVDSSHCVVGVISKSDLIVTPDMTSM